MTVVVMDGAFNLLQVIVTLVGIVSSAMGDYKVINFSQRLDHFGYYQETLNMMFQQNVFINDTHWGGAKAGAPIFALFGGEKGDTFDPADVGILSLSAVKFKGLLLHIQHRFYGDSVPLGSIDLAMADEHVRGCLTTEQALQDFTIIIQSLKVNLSAHASPVIVVGNGYSGALAAWFRVKYNQVVVGALASSTPIFYYGNSTPGDGFCSVVSKDFEDVDPKCYQVIRRTMEKLYEFDKLPNGLKQLSQTFDTCRPLHSSKVVIQWVGQILSFAAKFVQPNDRKIQEICHKINLEADFDLEGIVEALRLELFNGEDCVDNYDLFEVESPFEPFSNFTIAWAWQRCTELIVPIGCAHETMLPAWPFNRTQFDNSCRLRFGRVSLPRSPISFYGGHDIVESLKGFGGNIIFSNGLRDPFSSASILDDLSKTIVAIKTTRGSNSMDMDMVDDHNDPKWLKHQREEILRIFRSWIETFHHQRNKGFNVISTSNNVILNCLKLLVLLYMWHLA